MTALYLDENVAVELAATLRRYGHSVSSAADERRLGASDAHQLLYAAQRNWVIVTHNRYDFHLLHTAWLLWSDAWRTPQQHAGILIIDQSRRFDSMAYARLIADFVATPEAQLDGALYDWKPARGWLRYHQ